MIKLKSLILENSSKLIVYHGTGVNFRKFDIRKSTQGIIWFTSDIEKIKNKEAGANGHGFLITAEVSINNPAGWNEYDKYGLFELKHMGYDGAILKDPDGQFDCFVFSANQIRILKKEKI